MKIYLIDIWERGRIKIFSEVRSRMLGSLAECLMELCASDFY